MSKWAKWATWKAPKLQRFNGDVGGYFMVILRYLIIAGI
jgi:hypothetical protein